MTRHDEDDVTISRDLLDRARAKLGPDASAVAVLYYARDLELTPSTRRCGECGRLYDLRREGKGGGCATDRDRELFPFDERTHTGVRPERTHWMNGAHCSDRCYDAAYYEPPFPYGP